MPRSRVLFLAILAVFIIAAILLGVLRPQIEQQGNVQATQQAAANTVTIRVNYGTEKRRWFEDAVARFEAVNPGVNVELIGQGSMASYQALSQISDSNPTFDGTKPIPTLWSPASEIQVNLLNGETQSPTRLGRDLAVQCKPLVLSPLAIMAWEDRAATFDKAFADKGGLNFNTLYEALTGPAGGRWAEIGGDPNWGLIKIGYTDPTESNSGVMMLIALANAFHQKPARVTGAEATAPDFTQFMAAISNAISQPLRTSSGLLMDDFIAKGPASYDMVIVYEALAIEHFKNAIGRHRQALRIIYPPFNLYSDHPQCLIDHPSITTAQREAANRFQQFLLSPEIQRLSLQYGYRPADLTIPLFGANTAFDDPELQKAGLGKAWQQDLVVPDGNTIQQLLTVWRRNFQG